MRACFGDCERKKPSKCKYRKLSRLFVTVIVAAAKQQANNALASPPPQNSPSLWGLVVEAFLPLDLVFERYHTLKAA